MKLIKGLWISEKDFFFKDFLNKKGNTFESDHIEKAIELLKSFDTFVDVGAHYGSWSIPLSKKFHRVIAFEPFAETFQCLAQNTRELPNIEINNCAIGDKEDKIKIAAGKYNDTNNPGGFTVVGKGNIPMITIDSLGLDSINLLKIDVEGYELYVLRGAVDTIKKCRPIVVIEENLRSMLEHNIPEGTAAKFLEELGATKVCKMHANLFYKFPETC